VLIAVLLSGTAFGKEPNVADYPLKAHVVGSAETLRPPFWCVYEIRIGNLDYVAKKRFSCNASISGMDLPARIDKNKLRLLVDGKQLVLDITGSGE
jgi:hypothetical protein